MEPRYRRMTEADLAATMDVRESNVENAVTREILAERHGITVESMRAQMRRDLAGFVSTVEGEVVGFCMGTRGTGEINVLSVRPEHEGRGIGRELLRLTGDWLFAAGLDRIWLASNPDPAVRAHGFYRHLGWRPDGRRVRDDEILVLERTGNSG